MRERGSEGGTHSSCFSSVPAALSPVPPPVVLQTAGDVTMAAASGALAAASKETPTPDYLSTAQLVIMYHSERCLLLVPSLPLPPLPPPPPPLPLNYPPLLDWTYTSHITHTHIHALLTHAHTLTHTHTHMYMHIHVHTSPPCTRTCTIVCNFVQLVPAHNSTLRFFLSFL